MAVKLRECEKNNDINAIVMDLIQALDHKVNKSNAEESTYQWNNFVKDFCTSPKSKMFKQKLSVASILWKYVKNRPGQKAYDDKLIDLNIEKIQKFIKNN